MQEDFLQFIWKHQYFNRGSLKTTNDEDVAIFNPGNQNFDAGPDFIEGKLTVGELTWTGHIEIHRRSSEWKQHRHHLDSAYNNVVLHVVWDDNEKIHRQDGTQIPTLELKNRVDKDLVHRYYNLIGGGEDIVCSSKISEVDPFVKVGMIEKALISRLSKKALAVQEIVDSCSGDWEHAAYRLLVMNFGFKSNKEAFLQLSNVVPLKVLLKNSDSCSRIEALLFGQAGFLSGRSSDRYQMDLKNEFAYLKHKYSLKDNVLNLAIWKFGRLRPPNFPTNRIAQLSALIHSMKNIFSVMISTDSIQTLRQLMAVSPGDYWQSHYRFGEETKQKKSQPGKASIDVLIINTAIPLLAAYSKYTGDQVYMDRVISLIQMIDPETNKITRAWNEVGMEAISSADSQGMIELFNSYCLKKKCLSCNIGTSILKQSLNSDD